MELQFNKTMLPCLRWLTREIKDQEQTQELRLPDGMPDIGRVLASWGQPVIRGKEWRSGSMSVSGGIMVWVLYSPEGGGLPQWLESWLPFQLKWDLPETDRDGTILVQPVLRGIDARSVSARKLMIRGAVSLLGEAAVATEMEIFTPTTLPEDVQVLKNTYPLMIPVEAGEKTFLIDEVMELPESAVPMDKPVRYEVMPTLVEKKVMADKVVFRGTANLHILYLGTDGLLHSWDFEMPFSQYAELDKEYGPEAEAEVTLAVTNMELETTQEEGSNWKTSLLGQYVIYDRPMVELVQDAYSPVRTVRPNICALSVLSVLDKKLLPMQPEVTIPFDGVQLADWAFYPEHPKAYTEGEQIAVEQGGLFQILGYDNMGELTAAQKHWESADTVASSHDSKAMVSIRPAGKLSSAVTSQGVQLNTDLSTYLQTVSARGIPMVESLELGEVAEPDSSRPGLILRRAGEDSLWEIAKQTGSTVSAIREANDLQQEPDPGKMLLIPLN